MWKVGLLVVAFLLGNITAIADEPATFVLGPDGKPVRMKSKRGDGPGESPKPDGESGKSEEKDKGGDAKKKEGEDEDSVIKVIRRGDISGEESDPEELKATLGDDGKVAFQFRNQPWGDLMQWLSDITSQPLDLSLIHI